MANQSSQPQLLQPGQLLCPLRAIRAAQGTALDRFFQDIVPLGRRAICQTFQRQRTGFARADREVAQAGCYAERQ
ncbi:hypothetical protein BI343_02305 [Chromobacterium amazonense]|nr:hypothetical protein BI343_02305 [Chromobacterium amazonense]